MTLGSPGYMKSLNIISHAAAQDNRPRLVELTSLCYVHSDAEGISEDTPKPAETLWTFTPTEDGHKLSGTTSSYANVDEATRTMLDQLKPDSKYGKWFWFRLGADPVRDHPMVAVKVGSGWVIRAAFVRGPGDSYVQSLVKTAKGWTAKA